jgi:tRNA(adenine34) deaminase
MPVEEPTERDYALMDRVLQEARAALAAGGAGVAALLASPNKIIAVGLNTIQDTGDMTNHAEMVLLRQMDYRLMNDVERRTLSVYVTLEPCLMCSAALSFVGVKRVVYAALAEDANSEQIIVRGLTLPKVNDHFLRGPFVLVPGVRRTEGRALLEEMGKAAGAPADLET